jgi:transposase InsO family protein
MRFLEDIMFRFGCPRRIVTDSDSSFRADAFINFCEYHGITLIHSTPKYPQGNGLAESSNKSLLKIFKKLLEDNKKAWDSKLKFTLWVDRITTKRSLGTSPFHIVYGVEAFFPTQLAFPVTKFLQDYQGQPDDMVRRVL